MRDLACVKTLQTNLAKLKSRARQAAVSTCLLGTLLVQPLVVSADNNQSAIPNDVSSYEKKRNNCDSLRGDIPEQDPTASDTIHRLTSDINESCKGTDLLLKQLKEKYAGDESVLKRLSGYEENIEADMSF